MKSGLLVSSFEAPFTADPARPAFVTLRTKSGSLRRESAAPCMAPPLTIAASVTKASSALNDFAAYCKAAPFCSTASRIKDLSFVKAPLAKRKASPRLKAIAVLMTFLSSETDVGLFPNTLQSIMTAEVHRAVCQLLLLSVISPASFFCAAEICSFWAAAVIPAKTAALTATTFSPSSKRGMFFRCLLELTSEMTFSSSAVLTSAFMFRSLQSFCAVFSARLSETCADASMNNP
mmetsp:Transcript_109111/g.233176  ORF Transcript_109111/g.233176 Transcript_109111/m.233176 type:complete len:234 (+) Transcript_109111:300-1001(+)